MTESKIRAKKTKSGTACIALRQLATIAGTVVMTLIRTTNRVYDISSNHNRIPRVVWTFDMFDPFIMSGRRSFLGSNPVSSTNKTDHHDIADILLNETSNTITL